MSKFITLSAITCLGVGCAAKTTAVEPAPVVEEIEVVETVEEPQAPAPEAVSMVTLAADTEWAPINPEDPEGMQWSVIDGNPGEGAFVGLVKMPAGYATPVHSHPANFLGVALAGTALNGRSAEDHRLIPPGTVWTEPAGEVHFTGCTEEADCIFVGHMDGAIGMNPAEGPMEGDMQMTATALEDMSFVPVNPDAPGGPAAFVFEGEMEAGPFRALVSYPAGASSPEHTHSASYSGVVLGGELAHGQADAMGPGSSWTEVGGDAHVTSCVSEEACFFLVSFQGAFDMVPVAPVEAPVE
jgi:quercetin dioxygenase-like cupin family protein